MAWARMRVTRGMSYPEIVKHRNAFRHIDCRDEHSLEGRSDLAGQQFYFNHDHKNEASLTYSLKSAKCVLVKENTIGLGASD
jgi:hypothetical protein